jgi:hypothetical protein
MSCERFRPGIAAHAGGAEIDAAAARHLSDCARCRRLLETRRQLLAELDGELARSLSIGPSPDFVAGAARHARDAGRAPVHRGIPVPVWAGLGVAAAIVMAVLIRQPGVQNSSRPVVVYLGAESVRSSPAGQASALAPESAVGPGSDPGRSAPARARKSPPVAAARRSISVEPPVMVEPERALAIQRLRELMTLGRLNEEMLPPPLTPEAALAELTIAPLEIAEIRVPDVEIVGRPPAAPERQ